MASIEETHVDITIYVAKRGADGLPAADVRIVVEAISYDAADTPLRYVRQDITDQVSAARRTGALDLWTDVETRVKSQWSIP